MFPVHYGIQLLMAHRDYLQLDNFTKVKILLFDYNKTFIYAIVGLMYVRSNIVGVNTK